MPPARRALLKFRPKRKSHDDQWVTYAFPDFGLYIFRSSRVYLSVRCGAMGKNVLGAHAHNDQLSLELNIDGEDVIRDPGTYLYMPVPEIRNQYRSVTAHFTPQAANIEPSRLDEHVFYLNYENEGEVFSKTISAHSRIPIEAVLNLGSGGGNHDFCLRRRFQVTGVDLSPGMIEHASSLNPGTRYHEGDIRTVRLEPESFDAVVCFDSIAYMLSRQDLTAAFETRVRLDKWVL